MLESTVMLSNEGPTFRALESYGAVAPPLWDADFTDDPDGVPTGWTTLEGLEVGPATVISGVYRCPQDWWRARVRYDTAVTTDLQRIKAECIYVSAVNTVELAVGNVDFTSYQKIQLATDAHWYCVDAGGYAGPTGPFTIPAVGVPFTLDYSWNQCYFSFSIDGVL